MLSVPDLQHIQAPIVLAAPAFNEDKLLIYRELYYDGFSSIIAARDLTTGAAVAVKKVEYQFMRPSPIPIAYLQRRFSRKIRQQAARLRTLTDNSLLKMMEFVVEPTRIVIVTEMCMFGDLFNWMLQQPQLRVRDLCLIMQYVLQVIRYLHSQDLVHGNLTPTHILFQAMSPQSVTVMPDLSVRNELVTLTAKSPPVIDCWAPEYLSQFIDAQTKLKDIEEPVWRLSDERITEILPQPTKAMDIWSIGSIAHTALTGKAPFPLSESTQTRLDGIKRDKEELKHPLLQTLSGSVQNMLQQMLVSDPQERPSAERICEQHWFDDEATRIDNRNLLLTIEYDLMHTCRRYRMQGRHVFEQVFCDNSSVLDPTMNGLV